MSDSSRRNDDAPDAASPRDGSGAMFDRIAGRYDLLNRLTSLGLDRLWRVRLVRSLGAGAIARILDVATGTGDVAMAVARAYPEASVMGVDPSERMLAEARRKVQEAGLAARIALMAGDARSLVFPDDAFDATCVAFGIRNVPERPIALREMARVTRPGGRVAILELGEPRGGPLAALARFHVHHVVPRLGALLSSPEAYEYLRRSIAAFPPPEAFAAEMESAGLGAVEIERLGFGAAYLFVGAVPEPAGAPRNSL